MFKILVLKATYNLSDEATELFIRDRLSFREFLGLTFADTVPDARTIWLFAETLKEQNMERYLFDLYNEELRERKTHKSKTELFPTNSSGILTLVLTKIPTLVTRRRATKSILVTRITRWSMLKRSWFLITQSRQHRFTIAWSVWI